MYSFCYMCLFIIMYAKKLSRNYLYLTTCAPEGKINLFVVVGLFVFCSYFYFILYYCYTV